MLAPSNDRVEFVTVSERHDRILIVANGPSAELIPFRRFISTKAKIIAVNGAIRWLPRAEYFFTLDPDERLLPLIREKRDGVVYYVAVPDDYGTADARVHYHRTDPPAGVKYLKRISGKGPLGSKRGLAKKRDEINTGNSAYGAIGLAKHMGVKKLGIVGLDGNREHHAYAETRPFTGMGHLPRLFASCLRNLPHTDIRLGTPNSSIECFQRMAPDDLMDWLR